MILGTVQRILKEDLAKAGATPSWLDSLLSPLNQFIDQVSMALRGNLTLKDNFNCKLTTQVFTHGVELSVNSGPQKVTGVLPVLATGKSVISGCGVNLKGNGQLGVTINFGAGSGTAASVTLVILYG